MLNFVRYCKSFLKGRGRDTCIIGDDTTNLDEMFSSALKYYNDKDYGKCKKALKALADMDHSKSQYYLGLMYERGHGFKKNPRMAFQWFLRAADNDSGPAQSALYYVYKEGNGTQPNVYEAIKWCSRAAKKGLDDAMHNMGVNYLEGYGVHKSIPRALEWFQKAANNNYLLSQYSIAFIYLKGDEIDINYEEAYFWLLIARENSPCHFSDSDPFLNHCFSDTCSEEDKEIYRWIENAIGFIPLKVMKNENIRVKAFDWLKQHANSEYVDSNKFLKMLVRQTFNELNS